MNTARRISEAARRQLMSRRLLLASMALSWRGAYATEPPPLAAVDVTAFEADRRGLSDSSAAFASALEQSSRVHVPAGTYLVSNVRLRAGASISAKTPPQC